MNSILYAQNPWMQYFTVKNRNFNDLNSLQKKYGGEGVPPIYCFNRASNNSRPTASKTPFKK